MSGETQTARTVYLNGAFVEEAMATVPIMDRGLLFTKGSAYWMVALLMG